MKHLFAPLFALALVLAACGGQGDSDTVGADTGGDNAEPGEGSEPTPDPGTGGVVVLDVGLPEVTPEPPEGPVVDGREREEPEQGAVEHLAVPGSERLATLYQGAWLAPTEDGPEVVYPEDGTMMPRNVAPPIFQWTGPVGESYRLTLTTANGIHHVYTSDWKWEPEGYVWSRLMAEAEGNALEIKVAVLNEHGEIQRGPAIQMTFSSTAASGALYYWSPGKSAIQRLPMGETRPQTFLADGERGCVGCHALSPNGQRLAYSRGIPAASSLGVVSTIGDVPTEIMAEGRWPLEYPAFAPDSIQIAGAQNGRIQLINSDTGQGVGSIRSADSNLGLTFPSWSPSGTEIIFSMGSLMMGQSLSNAGLGRSTLQSDGSWSEPEMWLAPGSALNDSEALYFPAHSPNGRWVAFNHTNGSVAAGGAPYDASIWVVATTSDSPIRLDAANGTSGRANSWPKWAPTGTDGTMWITFTSRRPYGRLTESIEQIWVAAVVPGRALPGFDPSMPAFWMPGQRTDDQNHVAYWATYEKE